MIEVKGFGPILNDYLEYHRITQTDFANMLGISKKHINEIINGNTKISEELMIAISMITNIDVNLIYFAEQRKEMYTYLYSRYKTEKEIKKFLDSYYIKEMNQNGWIKIRDFDDYATSAIDLLSYLKLKDFKLEEQYTKERILYKKLDNANMRKVFLWIKHCDNLSSSIEVPSYKSSHLNLLIQELQEESNKPFNKDNLIKILNKYGIILIIEEALKGTKIRGCTMVKVKTPVIYLTPYFKTKDSLYFTLYHEISHIKRDYNKLINKVIINELDEKEEDKFALECMIPSKVWDEIQISSDKEAICKKYHIPLSFMYARFAYLGKIKYSSKEYNEHIEKINYNFC